MPSIFRVPKHKKFSYTPRFFDANKEARIRNEAKRNPESHLNSTDDGNRIQFRSSTTKRQKASSNFRLLVILCGLILLAYYLFFR